MNQKQFTAYCWSFYAPNEIYGDFFQNTLTREELASAVLVQMAKESYEGDTFDREQVRDILLETRRQAIENLQTRLKVLG